VYPGHHVLFARKIAQYEGEMLLSLAIVIEVKPKVCHIGREPNIDLVGYCIPAPKDRSIWIIVDHRFLTFP
jgi:hypothetical protein